jgi:uncharacterized RDD family membrane protein YckC
VNRDTVGVHPDEQVITGEAVAVDLRLAGAGSRGIAALIDIALATVIQLALIIVLLIIGAGTNSDAFATVLIVTILLVTLGYPVGMETLWRGRTVGKATMGLRVVRDDGGPIRFRHAFVRGLVGVILEKPGLTYGLAALIPMLASSRKKRLGDMAAGTIVLQERVPGRLEAPITMPPPLAGWAASLDLSAVDDGLALRMRHFLTRATQLTPDARATLEHQMVGEVTTRVGAPPPDAPGWAVLTAVLAERRRRAFAATQPVAQAVPWAPSPQWVPSPQPAVPVVAAPPAAAQPPPTPAPAASQPPPASTTGFAPPA